jgi:AraC-like DNA-binding protein
VRATLTRAALDAGFGSYPQFYRVFRRLTGVGPAGLCL